jgi:hypothetical protein
MSFPITFFSISLVTLDCLPVMLIGFIAILIIEIPLYVFLLRFHSLFFKVWRAPSSTLGPLLFNILISDNYNSIHNSRYLLFADDFKIYHTIMNVDDCKLLKHYIQCIIVVWLMVRKLIKVKPRLYLSVVKQTVFILIINYVIIW